ncbi:MAG: membrane or secreted protein [Flavobacteriales bacterium]|jgi:rRNA maturation endonuclease Nob1|nr:membrane or secreted protein [Flavobacteriales bacterium]
MKLALLTIALLALAFAGIAIKLLVKKDGEFAGTCASNNPLLKEEGANCSVCGARPQEQCKQESIKGA